MKVNWRRVYDRDVPRLIAGAIILIIITVIAARCAAGDDVRASWRPTSTWHWTGSPDATGYRLRWSAAPDCWPAANVVDVTGYACTPSYDCHGEIPMPAAPLAYIIVTSRNTCGTPPRDCESVTEHGPVAAVCD